MAIRIKSLITHNNGGDGARIVGDQEIDIGSFIAYENKGSGLNVISKESTYDFLGLPLEISPETLSKILIDISKDPSKESAEKIVKNSNIFSIITNAGLNISTLAANLITIATGANLQQYLNVLGS